MEDEYSYRDVCMNDIKVMEQMGDTMDNDGGWVLVQVYTHGRHKNGGVGGRCDRY